MTDNRKPSSIRGHAANDCPGIDECGQASSMHEQLSELTAAQARQESQLRVVVLDRARAEQLAADLRVSSRKRAAVAGEVQHDRQATVCVRSPVVDAFCPIAFGTMPSGHGRHLVAVGFRFSMHHKSPEDADITLAGLQRLARSTSHRASSGGVCSRSAFVMCGR